MNVPQKDFAKYHARMAKFTSTVLETARGQLSESMFKTKKKSFFDKVIGVFAKETGVDKGMKGKIR